MQANHELCVSQSWRATENEISVQVDGSRRWTPKHGLSVFLNPEFICEVKIWSFWRQGCFVIYHVGETDMKSFWKASWQCSVVGRLGSGQAVSWSVRDQGFLQTTWSAGAVSWWLCLTGQLLCMVLFMSDNTGIFHTSLHPPLPPGD